MWGKTFSSASAPTFLLLMLSSFIFSHRSALLFPPCFNVSFFSSCSPALIYGLLLLFLILLLLLLFLLLLPILLLPPDYCSPPVD